jgi:hypothetical protein
VAIRGVVGLWRCRWRWWYRLGPAIRVSRDGEASVGREDQVWRWPLQSMVQCGGHTDGERASVSTVHAHGRRQVDAERPDHLELDGGGWQQRGELLEGMEEEHLPGRDGDGPGMVSTRKGWRKMTELTEKMASTRS